MKNLLILLSITIITAFSFLPKQASAQSTWKEIDFNNSNLIVFHIRVDQFDNKQDAILINNKMSNLDEVYWCTVDGNKGTCCYIAEKEMDLQKVSTIFSELGYTVDFEMREKLSKEKYLQLNTLKNGQPLKLNTRNTGRDRYHMEHTKTIRQEKIGG